ncbi:putative cytochrome p450 [Rosellinia necatrix]|uniref:Putative cytochrome p450 n=1 Tax=Rosellinia necatrix TaxID=77044 RepID=A0A1W2TAG6_ROSNE|nr:putative cytochrome p450 [Rosellinia necatrix]
MLLFYLPVSIILIIIASTWHYSIVSCSKFKGVSKPEGSLAQRPQRQLKQWAKEYGELFQVRLNAERCVYVNSVEAARFIFDKQAAKTSSKAPLPVTFNLVSGGLRFFLMPKGRPWRTLRTIIQTQLTPIRSDSYMPYQEVEAKQLAFDLLMHNQENEEFFDHVKRYTMRGMMRVTYGIGIKPEDHDQMDDIYQILQDFSEATFTKPYLADSLQFLNLLPSCLQWWKNAALCQLHRQQKIWLKLWADLERRVEQQQSKECLGKRWIEVDQISREGRSISREQWAFFAGTMIEAGSLSQSSALNDCLRHLAANPQIQSRSHEELVRVAGVSRSPVLQDRPHCSYVRACIKEILRLVPSTSNGIAHYTTEEVIYKGYHIPKNTVVSLNLWALCHDETRYEQPTEFRPERYLKESAKERFESNNRIQPYGPDRFVWGAGRRICPGIYLADNSLFVALAKILWAFELLPPLDQAGSECALDTSEDSYENGRITIPKPFRLRFVSRGTPFNRVIIEEHRASRYNEAS